MAETSLDRYHTPTAEELNSQWKLPSYDKEKGLEKQELTNDQIRQVRQEIKDAQLKTPGVVCERDELKYLSFLANCDPKKRNDALNHLREHLQKKAEHLKEYQSKVEQHYSVDGRLNTEGQALMKKYQEMTGEERKEAAQKIDQKITERQEEKKSYEEILENSPHFTEGQQAKLTPEANKLFKAYQEAGGSLKDDLKKQLILKIRKLDRVEKECQQIYEKANEFYEQGKFTAGEILLNHIIAICDEYPHSPHFQVIREWNERDLQNMKEHTKTDREILKSTLLRDTFVGVEDLETAMKHSQKLVEQTEHFLNFTTNRNGDEVPRKEKYQSPYLKQLHQDADHENKVLLRMFEDAQEEQEKGMEQVKAAYREEMTTTAEGDEATVLAAAFEEELEKPDRYKRTDAAEEVLSLDTAGNRDILGLTEEQIEDSAEDGHPEIVLDLSRDNRARAEILKKAELVSANDTAVAVDGRLLTTKEQLEDAVDRQTQTFADRFVQKQKNKGDIGREHLDVFKDVMRQKTTTGQMSEAFTRSARDANPGIRLGKNFKDDQRTYAEDQLDRMGALIQPNTGKAEVHISNFAERLREKRQVVRRES